jgi:hypothetical protein
MLVMLTRAGTRKFRPFVLCALLQAVLATGSGVAQEGSTSASGAKPAGTPWSPPRTPDGQPDIQGMWIAGDWGRPLETPAPAAARPQSAPANRAALGPPSEEGWSDVKTGPGTPYPNPDRTPIIVDPPDGKIPWLPWAVKAKQYISRHQGTSGPVDPLFLDPASKCLPYGVPRINSPNPYSGYQFLQRPGLVAVYYEQGHQYRIIPLDGRPHVGKNIRLWNGNSRGRWEGNTLVVDVTNLNGKTWVFGRAASQVSAPFTSPDMRVVERLTFADPETIQYEVTIEDPNLYSRPWKISTKAFVRAPKDHRLFEYACHEGNRTTHLITTGNKK